MGNANILFVVFLIIFDRFDRWGGIRRTTKAKENIKWFWGLAIVFIVFANNFEKHGSLAGAAVMKLMFVIFWCGYGILGYAAHDFIKPKQIK